MRVLVFLLLLLVGCQSGVEQPALPEDKMVRIFADMAIAEAATNGVSGYDQDSLKQMYFRQVLQMHGITMEQYEKDLRIYSNDLESMRRLFEKAEVLVDQSKEH